MKHIKRLQLGKGGLSSGFIEQIKGIFLHEKVLKITILKSFCRDKKEARKIGEELVSIMGPKFGYKLVGYVLTIMKFRKEQGKKVRI